MRKEFLVISHILLLLVLGLHFAFTLPWLLGIFLILYGLGMQDYFQRSHTIRRNFPLFGRLRYVAESIRPELNQYFVESNTDGRPFNREERSIVYARSKGELDTTPFGTIADVYAPGYEWVAHSILPKHVDPKILRADIGGKQCTKPYSASLINVGAMSYGSLGKNAIRALSEGARLGQFATNTGEGGLSPYHLEKGQDLIWQLGTAYFGARDEDGNFNAQVFQEKARLDAIKMIEIKLSQGAKPGHGGILPGEKVNQEVADIRGVKMGRDVISPPGHSAFRTPQELLLFVQQLRDLSGGKPVGIKLCVGKRHEFLALCRAMEKYAILPDYFAVDGGEGGTGASPLEFSNHVGAPGTESLIFVHNALVGFGIRNEMSLISSGHVVTAFDAIKRLALGADHIYMARAMMFALGCIQARVCNTNRCPTGVTTNDRHLEAGLVPEDKCVRVRNFHRATLDAIAGILGAMALDHTEDLRPWHISRRISFSEALNYSEIYEYIEQGSLLTTEAVPKSFEKALALASSESFLSHQPWA
jgi:glutamate synthase domain-containing protein 2